MSDSEELTGFEVDLEGAPFVIARGLDLLAELENWSEDFLPDAVIEERNRMRAVVDEWVEFES